MRASLLLASVLALAACSSDAVDPLPAPRCAEWGSGGVLQVQQFAGPSRTISGHIVAVLCED